MKSPIHPAKSNSRDRIESLVSELMAEAKNPTGPTQIQPEYIRMPKPRQRDPIFGLTRAFYYKAEADGLIRFKRIRLSGSRAGATLIPVEAVKAMINRLAEEVA